VIVIGPMLAVVLAALVALGAVVLRLGELGNGREVVVAAVRAVAQLGAVALVIMAVLNPVG
jgi:putative ABC transport system permease protein